jgi:hypothetical protein
MKVSTMFAYVVATTAISLLACSSSSSGGTGFPQCQGNTSSTGPYSSACNSCIESKCGSQTSAVESDCGAYISCYDGCQCSDNSCLSGCQSKITGQCTTDYQAIVSCLTSNCASQCNASGDAG